jgi:predicted phosphoadenosine phosphosulfate sulfurtransferase
MSRKRWIESMVVHFVEYLAQYNTPQDFIRKYEESFADEFDERHKQNLRIRILKEVGFKKIN